MDTHFIVVLPAKPVTTFNEAPTAGERSVLDALEKAIEHFGNPSYREIEECARPGVSIAMIHKYLRRLSEKGYVKLPPPRRARGIRLLRVPEEVA